MQSCLSVLPTSLHPQGGFPAEYIMDEGGQGHLTCLDSSHSHSILVDAGPTAAVTWPRAEAAAMQAQGKKVASTRAGGGTESSFSRAILYPTVLWQRSVWPEFHEGGTFPAGERVSMKLRGHVSKPALHSAAK